MFAQYITNLFKKHTLTYVVIAVCEVIMIVISMFALGVVLDYVSVNDLMRGNTQSRAKSYIYSFGPPSGASVSEENAVNALPSAGVMRERIYEFCEKSPVKIKTMEVKLDYNLKYNYYHSVMYFQNYDEMVEYCTENDVPLSSGSLPTMEQFTNHEKVVLLSTGARSDSDEYVFSDDRHLLFGNDGDEYLIISKIPWNALILFLGSEPDDAEISGINFSLEKIPTQQQADETDKLFREIVVGEYSSVCGRAYTPELNNLLDIRKDAAIIIIAALLMMIMSFNYMTIIKFIIEKRKKDYAVFRLCGFSKRKAMMLPFLETVGISAVCAIVSCVIFELLKPLTVIYAPVVYSMFDFGCYVCFVPGFAAVTAVLFFIYVLPSLNKSVTEELRGI